ncbi:MAG: nitrate reductase [Comamonadaceae bacterium]|nr:nitrate reductase [Comamonadaceae bacterium]
MSTAIQRLLRTSPQQLRAFEATARLVSVTQAARELHVSQPTVSVQLRELATLVGEPLFEPVGRGIRLTPAGEALQATVTDIVACWQRFEDRLGDLHGLLRGRLRIAAVTTAEYFVPDLLGPFAALHPGVEIDLAVENRDRVIARLHRQADDLAVMMLPPDDLPLHSQPFLDNPLVVIAPRSHPQASHPQPIRLSALSGERWLMREAGSGTRLVAERHFANHGFAPRIAMSLGSNEAIKHAVGAGLGLAVVSALAVEPADAASATTTAAPWVRLPVEGFPIERRWSLVWRSDAPLSAPARQFVAYLQGGQDAALRAVPAAHAPQHAVPPGSGSSCAPPPV